MNFRNQVVTVALTEEKMEKKKQPSPIPAGPSCNQLCWMCELGAHEHCSSAECNCGLPEFLKHQETKKG